VWSVNWKSDEKKSIFRIEKTEKKKARRGKKEILVGGWEGTEAIGRKYKKVKKKKGKKEYETKITGH